MITSAAQVNTIWRHDSRPITVNGDGMMG